MRGRLLFVAGAAVGYVLGARAGRKRYEQIAGAASRIWESPGIQKQVNKAEDYAAAKIGEIPGALVTGVQKIARASASRAASGSQTSTVPDPATADVAETVAEARSAASKASSAATGKAKKTS